MQWLTKERNQKVGNLIPSQYVTQTSPHHRRQTPSVPLSSLMGIQLQINKGFPRFQRASQGASIPPQHSGESRQTNRHPPRDAICPIESNICIKQNIYFVDADQFRQEVDCQWLLESWY